MTRISVISSEKSHGFMESQDSIILTEVSPPQSRKKTQSCSMVLLVVMGILLIAFALGFIILTAMFPPRICPVVSCSNRTVAEPFSYKKPYDAWMKTSG